MCWMTDTFFAYCDHHGPRTIVNPCVRALVISDGMSTTGCWESSTGNHVRVLDFCHVCKKTGKDTEEYRQDKKKAAYSFFSPMEGDSKSGIEGVTIRPIEERGKGKDFKVWLKSFGGSSAAASAATSANTSRRGSMDIDARRGSHHSIQSAQSAKSCPEITSPSRYSRGASAAWGMTSEELRARSSTLSSPHNSRSRSRAPRHSANSSVDNSRRHSLAPVQEDQDQPYPIQQPASPNWKAINYLDNHGKSQSNEALAPKELRTSVNLAFLPPKIWAMQEDRIAREQKVALRKKEEEEIRGMMEQARVEKEVRRLRSPRLKAGERAESKRQDTIKKEEEEDEEEKELREVMDMPARLQKEIRRLNLKAGERAVRMRDGALKEETEAPIMLMKAKNVDEEKYEMRKDSGICMEHDVME